MDVGVVVEGVLRGGGVLWLYVQRFIKPPKVNTISSSDIPCHFSPDHGLLFFILHRGSFFNLQNEAEETEESRARGAGGGRCQRPWISR